MALKTGFFRVARSGATVDGRTIKPEWLEQAAKNYSRDKFVAMIWPDHMRYYNLGMVDAIKVEKNSEGGIDLLASLEPNDFYRDNVAYGQRLFTSVEIAENFAKTGEAYLIGLGATDQPASQGTQPVQFSQQQGESIFVSSFIEAEPKKQPGFFDWFSSKPPQDTDMTKEEMAQLFVAQTPALATAVSQAVVAGITEAFKTQAPQQQKPLADGKPLTRAEAEALFKQLQNQESSEPHGEDAPLTVASFKQLAADFFKQNGEGKPKGEQQEEPPQSDKAFNERFDRLEKLVFESLGEQPGTDTGKDEAQEDTKSYV